MFSWNQREKILILIMNHLTKKKLIALSFLTITVAMTSSTSIRCLQVPVPDLSNDQSLVAVRRLIEEPTWKCWTLSPVLPAWEDPLVSSKVISTSFQKPYSTFQMGTIYASNFLLKGRRNSEQLSSEQDLSPIFKSNFFS